MKDAIFPIVALVAFFVAILGGCACIDWYRAGVQAKVWNREGIEITQWEVFVGVKPAERSISIKPAGGE